MSWGIFLTRQLPLERVEGTEILVNLYSECLSALGFPILFLYGISVRVVQVRFGLMQIQRCTANRGCGILHW
jgi:hypothetical protein